MRRRDFIAGLGPAACLSRPGQARAQQSKVPVIGFLGASSPEEGRLRFFREGLFKLGFVEGQNVAIEYRWAEGKYDRLPQLAEDLIHRRVDVIVTSGSFSAARAAKAATTTIPIVFWIGPDPVSVGLVASFNRPGGNLTGIGMMQAELEPKRIELLQKLVPNAARFFHLANPVVPDTILKGVQEAAASLGQQSEVVTANTSDEVDAAFASLARKRADALLVTADPMFLERRTKLAVLAARYAIPAIYWDSAFPDAGGLMSYGASLTDTYLQAGVYVGRILKGEKPAELPIVQPARLELVINRSTAKAIGVEIPQTLLAIADKVID